MNMHYCVYCRCLYILKVNAIIRSQILKFGTWLMHTQYVLYIDDACTKIDINLNLGFFPSDIQAFARTSEVKLLLCIFFISQFDITRKYDVSWLQTSVALQGLWHGKRTTIYYMELSRNLLYWYALTFQRYFFCVCVAVKLMFQFDFSCFSFFFFNQTPRNRGVGYAFDYSLHQGSLMNFTLIKHIKIEIELLFDH